MDMQLLLIVGGLVLLAGLLILWRQRGAREEKPRRNKVRVGEDLDTLMSWHPQATRIMTGAERTAYAALCGGLPDHIILAQVSLARFLKVPTRHSYVEWLRRVGVMCPDLVVCDSASQVVAVVDVRAPESQENERAKQRHVRMARVLKAADIPLHVWREDALPNATGARNAILGLSSDMPNVAPAPAVKPTPGAQPVRPVVELARLREPEAVIEEDGSEQRDPPSSTWFDEMDSAAAPLAPAPPRGPGPSIR